VLTHIPHLLVGFLRIFVLDVSTIDNLPAKECILVARHPGPEVKSEAVIRVLSVSYVCRAMNLDTLHKIICCLRLGLCIILEVNFALTEF
jgi:hypothetical protein